MKLLAKFLKSIKVRVFLSIMLLGILITVGAGAISYYSFREETLNRKLTSVTDFANRISKSMISNVFFSPTSNRGNITKELDIMAGVYEGRIIVADSALRIIYDSYGNEVGKTLISTEAIKAIKGSSNRYTDLSNNIIELTIPIIAASYDNVNRGVLFINFSIKDEYRFIDVMQKRLWLITIVSWVVLLAFALFASGKLTRLFGQIKKSMHHVSDGYFDDKVTLKGYTEMTEIADSMNEMLSGIRKLENSRQEFVSNVSHELKTPITSMKILADTLINQPDVPIEMYQEFMQDINSELDRENDIINDLLTLVKLDKKKGDMHIAEVDINEMVANILKRLLPIAQETGVELIYESYRDVIAQVDELKLARAISNLIENGIKYNQEAPGWVKVSVNSDHKYFIITVADSGIGIPADSLELIFERFYRVDKTRSRETGGTGLGLAITRSVVQMHNGAIKVESKPGEGTTFTVRIPFIYIPLEEG